MNLSKELGKGTYRKICRKFKDFAKVENRVEKIMKKDVSVTQLPAHGVSFTLYSALSPLFLFCFKHYFTNIFRWSSAIVLTY